MKSPVSPAEYLPVVSSGFLDAEMLEKIASGITARSVGVRARLAGEASAASAPSTAGLMQHELCMLWQAELFAGKGLPPQLREEARASWARVARDVKTSDMQRAVRRVLRELGADPMTEKLTDDGNLSVDLAIVGANGQPVAIEVNGPSHYARNEPGRELGRTRLRRQLLEGRGWQVVTISHVGLDGKTSKDRTDHLRRILSRKLGHHLGLAKPNRNILAGSCQ